MKLLSRKKAKPATDAAPRQDEGVSPSSSVRSPADDLVGLEKLAEWKQNLKRLEADYRRGQAALVAARRQVNGVDPIPEPDLSWHVRRELLIAAGDAAGLAQFDQEHGPDLEAELAARQRALQGGAEAKAKVKALTAYLTDIARQMAELSDSGLQRTEMKRLFKPSAERMLVAAQAFAKVHREMQTMASVLLGVCRTHESYVDGSKVSPYGFQLIEGRERGEWLSTMIEGLGYRELDDLNHYYTQHDSDLSKSLNERLEQAGLDSQWVHVYHPASDSNPREVWAPDPNPPKSKQQFVIPIH